MFCKLFIRTCRKCVKVSENSQKVSQEQNCASVCIYLRIAIETKQLLEIYCIRNVKRTALAKPKTKRYHTDITGS